MKTKELWYKNDLEDKHTIHYRDPLQAINSLLGNPAYASDIVYRPGKTFTDSSKSKRIYNEMWTGECLVICAKYSTCPKCLASEDELGLSQGGK
jgi:hypothetical protein